MHLSIWMQILDAADYDPLLAQEIERELGALPEPLMRAVLAAGKGNPIRAREILRGVSARWWYRWAAVMEQRARVHDSENQ